ncbi:hypothetical protein KC359_g167 [Hortaea werneckii]|nr:hypothetical protein KC359_g167 [Hortaea werneckii]
MALEKRASSFALVQSAECQRAFGPRGWPCPRNTSAFPHHSHLDLSIVASADNDLLLFPLLAFVNARRPDGVIYLKDIMSVLKLCHNIPLCQTFRESFTANGLRC